MQFKQKLAYIALGGLLVFMGQLLPSIIDGSAIAQRPRVILSPKELKFAEFDTVTCKSLKVVDGVGKLLVEIKFTLNGGKVMVWGNDGREKASMFGDQHGGHVAVFGTGRFEKAALRIDERGNGDISAWDKNGHRIDMVTPSAVYQFYPNSTDTLTAGYLLNTQTGQLEIASLSLSGYLRIPYKPGVWIPPSNDKSKPKNTITRPQKTISQPKTPDINPRPKKPKSPLER
ncbi:MAG: hypothetical protein IH951_15885 [Bacteroidetes bacterium]|nr:hypothetical protein [Bacteroidota bacterium]